LVRIIERDPTLPQVGREARLLSERTIEREERGLDGRVETRGQGTGGEWTREWGDELRRGRRVEGERR
jgi:hypothetical protein